MPSALHPKNRKLSPALELKRNYLLRNFTNINPGVPLTDSEERKCDNAGETELPRQQYRYTNRIELSNPATKASTHPAISYGQDAKNLNAIRFAYDDSNNNKHDTKQSDRLSNVRDLQLGSQEQYMSQFTIDYTSNSCHNSEYQTSGISFGHLPSPVSKVASEASTNRKSQLGVREKDLAVLQKATQIEKEENYRNESKNGVKRGPQRKRVLQETAMKLASTSRAVEESSGINASTSASVSAAIDSGEAPNLKTTRSFIHEPIILPTETDEHHWGGSYSQAVITGQNLGAPEPDARNPLREMTRECHDHIYVRRITTEPRLQEDGKATCPHCEQQFDLTDFREHVSHCQARHMGLLRKRNRSNKTSRCWKCNRRFSNANGPLSKLDLHVAKCIMKVCSRCHKKNIPPEEFNTHFATCKTKRHTGCGNPVPINKFDAHVKKCPWAYCGRCGVAKIPVSDLERHQKLCRMRMHAACSVRVHESLYQDHLKMCPWAFCSRCSTCKIPIEDYRNHFDSCQHLVCGACRKRRVSGDHDCGLSRCSSCGCGIPTESYPSHKASCVDGLHEQRFALQKEHPDTCCYLQKRSSKRCKNTRWNSLDVCEEHARMRSGDVRKNTAAEKARLRTLLIDHNTEILTKAVLSTVNLKTGKIISGFSEIWDTFPERILECDTEGNIHSRLKKPELTFQLTIKNAKGEDVVSRRVINHEHLTKYELHEQCGASSSYIVDASFRKYYGKPNSEPATGHPCTKSSTWLEVAEDIEAYIERYRIQGPSFFLAFVDWSNSGIDLAALRAGLESVEKGHLVPKCPVFGKTRVARGELETESEEGKNFNPIQWWRTFRRFAGLDGELSLSLSNLFSILFPDHKWLFDHAHDSDADVDMLHMVLEFTIHVWRARRELGQVDPAIIGEADDIEQEIRDFAEIERDQDDLEAYVDELEEE
jgi:hypothetical protein